MKRSWPKRSKLVALNTIRQAIFPLQNLIMAFLVVRFADEATWGAFVYWLIPVSIAVPIFSWGHKDYVLRNASQNPAWFQHYWLNNLVTRAVFPGIMLLGIFTVLSIGSAPQWLWLWFLALGLEKTFEPAIHFERRYGYVLGTDLLALSLLVGGVLFSWTNITIPVLVGLNIAASLVKVVLLGIRHIRWDFGNVGFKPDFAQIRGAFPFFLLGFTGLLFSRIDLYSVNYLLPEAQVGQYQVLINLFIYQQAIPGFILMPFVKNLFRFNRQQFTQLSRNFLWLGLGFLAIGLPLSYGIINWGFAFGMGWTFFALGGLYILPVFVYSPLVYGLFRANQERNVVKINLLGALCNLTGNLLLIPSMGLIGALLAGTIAQWMVLGVYWEVNRMSLNKGM